MAGAPSPVAKEPKTRLEGTLGVARQPRFQGTAPTFSQHNVEDIANAAIQFVVDARLGRSENTGESFSHATFQIK